MLRPFPDPLAQGLIEAKRAWRVGVYAVYVRTASGPTPLTDNGEVLLHVTGTPGTGKTCFTRWLERTHGYTRWPPGEEPVQGSPWLVEIDRLFAVSNDVVVDYGIPADFVPSVKQELIIKRGFETWWFDGDRDTGREVFMNRPDHPATPTNYLVYMAGIHQHWSSYQSLFDDRWLDVLRPGPVWMPNEERLAAIEVYHRRS